MLTIVIKQKKINKTKELATKNKNKKNEEDILKTKKDELSTIENGLKKLENEKVVLENSLKGKDGEIRSLGQEGNLGKGGALLKGIGNGLTKKASLETKDVANFINAESQILRLENLIKETNDLISKENSNPDDIEYNTSSDGTDRETPATLYKLHSLSERIAYIKSKLEAGLVNYGDKNYITIQYELLSKLSEAEITLFDSKATFDRKLKLIALNSAIRDDKKTEIKTRLSHAEDKYLKDKKTLFKKIIDKNIGIKNSNKNWYIAGAVTKGAILAGTVSATVGEIFRSLGWGAPAAGGNNTPEAVISTPPEVPEHIITNPGIKFPDPNSIVDQIKVYIGEDASTFENRAK